ncbi:hypothetical protein I79_003814 [Cricetulus griseus]|uniref:Secreted protein n=1 Tax=Cricetulus griseus TaxID=10029 RepID=G3H0Z5_CRIGR|nr:hypothetical protein I79_003814 [Cricetulus griseus]
MVLFLRIIHFLVCFLSDSEKPEEFCEARRKHGKDTGNKTTGNCYTRAKELGLQGQLLARATGAALLG